MADLPENFGHVDTPPGVPIINKSTILSEIDQILGRNKPPALEYILVRPFSHFDLPFLNWGLHFNTFGHAALRYTLPDGEQLVMNIEGKRSGHSMVQFRKPEEFFYGTDVDLTGEQRGLYNRSMVGIRIEELPAEQIQELHNFFLKLKADHEAGRNGFWILPPFLEELLKPIYPSRVTHYGNCARWTSGGLKQVGLLRHYSYWPKSIWVNLFENYPDRDNLSVVYYNRVQHAKQFYGTKVEPKDNVSPWQIPRNHLYYNLERFAHCTVTVPEHTTQAIAIRNPNPEQPSPWRNLVNHWSIVVGSVTLTSAILTRRFLLPKFRSYFKYRKA